MYQRERDLSGNSANADTIETNCKLPADSDATVYHKVQEAQTEATVDSLDCAEHLT